MAGKKKKSVAKKAVKEVLVATVDDQAEPAPAPAIVTEEQVFKVVNKGQIIRYTESEYRKKYGPK